MVTVNPLAGIFSGASSQIQKTNSQIADTIASLVTGNANAQSGGDVASTSVAALLQSQVSTLQQAGANIAQSFSLTQTAGDAITQQLDLVGQLQQLAAQANSGVLNNTQRQELNTQAQGLVQQLDHIGANTEFNGIPLLDGSYSTNLGAVLGTGNSGVSLSIPSLTAQSLFSGGTIDLKTQAGAQSAATILQTAANTLQAAQTNVGSFSQGLDIAAATVESTQFNLAAATSNLSDTDFAQASTALSQLNLQQNVQYAVLAQANNIPAGVLDLLNKPPV